MAPISVLYPDAAKAAEKSETRKIVLNNTQSSALSQLAEKRGQAVKSYLVDNKKINASRLIVCEPEYREDSKQALVEIREALIYSELPRHMDVPPFSVADKPLKMKENEKSHFSIFVL